MNNEVNYVREYGFNKVVFNNKEISIDSDVMRMGYPKGEPIDITSSIHRVCWIALCRYTWIITDTYIEVTEIASGPDSECSNTLLVIDKYGITFKPDVMWDIFDEIIYTIDTFNTKINGKCLRDFLDLYDIWDYEYIDKNGKEYEWSEPEVENQ